MSTQIVFQIGLVGFVAAVGFAMLAVERIHPGREFPRVRGWLARAIWINSVQVGAIVAAGLIWNRWLGRHRAWVGSSRVDLQACKLEYSIVSPK